MSHAPRYAPLFIELQTYRNGNLYLETILDDNKIEGQTFENTDMNK